MACQVEAERERRAKIIAADGEMPSSQKLQEAAELLARTPPGMQLRYLQTLVEIGTQNSAAIVFPLPMELLNAPRDLAERRSLPRHHENFAGWVPPHDTPTMARTRWSGVGICLAGISSKISHGYRSATYWHGPCLRERALRR
jgi:hypothetical protein